MSNPEYPHQASGEPDHAAAAEEMGVAGATPVSPVFINTGAETVALVNVDGETGEVTLTDARARTIMETWETTVEWLWDDWVNGSLTFRRQTFLAPEDAVYDSESHVAIHRLALAELADYAYDREMELDEHVRITDVCDAIEQAFDALEHVPEER